MAVGPAPNYDRANDMLTSSLRRDERNATVANAMKIVNAELPIFTMYYNDRYRAYASTPVAPKSATASQGVWNIQEWTWAS